MTTAIYLAVFVSAVLIFNVIATYLFTTWFKWQAKQAKMMTNKLDDSFIFLEKKKVIVLTAAPLILGFITYLLLGNIFIAIAGGSIGLAVPTLIANAAKQKRIKDFQDQLVDTLMIFSSSLKGGLSFIQALEIVCEEMPTPTSQEFGLILKENKLGVGLEDSLEGLRKRMPLEEVGLIVSSILVAKETGGELTRVFSRLVETIRDNVKLKEKIATLTLQGKLQGYIMACLPFVFTFFVYKQNPEHFSVMLESQFGQMLLAGAIVWQIIGMVLIRVMSKLKV
ncbi:MAG: hypothetical protein GY858_06120 [Candidatus Omnitrophica bacterium]|nr:hypothetical protein [Candidatus Omnitrophota bacterium]